MKKGIVLITILAVGSAAAYSFAQMGHGMMRSGHMMGGGYMMGKMHDYSPVHYDPQQFSEDMHISRGGQLYDDWWKTMVDVDKPEDEHPLWKTQKTNTRSGYSTYRCKECHGWDYRGKDGAYGKGSHFTGFKGIYGASQSMSEKELAGVLKGSSNRDHDFSSFLKDDDIADLALFLKRGVTDARKFVDSSGVPPDGDVNAGGYLFNMNCAQTCHGGLGAMINFGDREKPEFVGTVAGDNPWEFLHKVRAGQPGTRMPSAIINKWSDKEIIDLVSYARTLPKHFNEEGGGHMMMGGMGHHAVEGPPETRGFGPLMR
jgi:mono/diheme cytochrome c family protein